MPLEIRVRYFAAVRERLGRDEEQLSLPEGSDVEALFAALCERHPPLQAFRAHLRFAVQMEFRNAEHALQDGDEVALIPPVAGG